MRTSIKELREGPLCLEKRVSHPTTGQEVDRGRADWASRLLLFLI